jgi:chitin disaccharide deacetylase
MAAPTPGPRRFLIVNADDFGMTPEINRGILRGHIEGIVTSTSLMVRRPAASHAVELSQSAPHLAVGLHLDLGEWSFRNGDWHCDYQVVSFQDKSAIAQEIRRQLEQFRQLTGRNPTHIDSHQHMHRREPIRSVLLEETSDLHVPVREEGKRIQYCGAFYGQNSTGTPAPHAISVAALGVILKSLSAGVTELACHPGEGTNAPSPYNQERAIELSTLCANEVRITIEREHIQLCNFITLPDLSP